MTNINHSLRESLSPFSRRAFLKGSLHVGLGASAALSLGCSSPTPSSHSHLSVADADVLSKLISTIFSSSDTIFPASQVPMLENVNHLLGFVPSDLRADLSAGIALFNYGAIVLGLHFASFLSLDEEAATRYVNEWQNGNEIQRGLMAGLKKLIYTAYWRDPRTWSPVEFDGPVSDKWGLDSLGNAPMPADSV